METYFDSSPATGITVEDQVSGIPLSDEQLRRTNPKRYDKNQDIYNYPNEHMHDTDVSNRTDGTRLSWKFTDELVHAQLQELDWQLEAYASREAVSFDTFVQTVRPYQRWWYAGSDLVLLTGAGTKVAAVTPAMSEGVATRMAVIADAVWTEFHETGTPNNAVAEVWDTKNASMVLVQLRDQQKVARLFSDRAAVFSQLSPMERLAATIKDPLLAKIAAEIASHSEYSAVTPQQIKSLGNFEESEGQILDALQELAKYGHVYPLANNLWTTTKETSKLRPYLVYNKFQGMKFKDFSKDIFPVYWAHFKSQHPELQTLFNKIERSTHNFQGFQGDVWGLVNHEAPESPVDPKGKPFVEYGEVPEYLTSVEHAISEEINFMNHPKMPLFGGSVPSLLPKANAYTSAISAQRNPRVPEAVVVHLQKTVAPGTYVGTASQELILSNVLKQLKYSANAEVIKTMQRTFNWTAAFEAAPHVLSAVDNAGNMVRKSQAYISAHANEAALYLTNAMGTAGDPTLIAPLFNAVAYTGLSLKNVRFSGMKVIDCTFDGADLSGSDWSSCTIKGNSFFNAILRNAVFTPASVRDNNIQGADVDGASLPEDFLSKNSGTPKNLTITSIKKDKGVIKDLLTHPTSRSFHLAIDEAERPAAERLVQALRGILSNRTLSRLRFPSFSALRFTKTSALSPSQIEALKTFLADPTSIPDVGDIGSGFFPWVQQMNANGDLAAAGFSKKDVATLFGKARNLVEGPKKKEAPADPYAAKLQEFIDQYKSAPEIPGSALMSILGDTSGPLAQYIQSLTSRKDTLTQSQLFDLYHSLKDVVKDQQYLPGIKATKHINMFPHSSFIDNLSGGHHGVAGEGQQFGIAITPEYGRIPRDVATISRYAIQVGATHLFGEALAFSRITPLAITIIKDGQTTQKTIWQVTEQQSDAVQKIAKYNKGQIEKRTGLTNVEETFRKYFKHWPETLLHAILEHAQQAGVSEVWVPKGEDVANKTSASRVKNDSWDYVYDRPAKAFGGTLKNVGTALTLDPGSSYDETSSMFYVIPIPQKA